MPYKTIYGNQIKMAHDAGRIFGPCSGWTDEQRQIIHDYQQLYKEMWRMEAELVNARNKNKELTAENKCLLKIINENIKFED